jgi:hypothetical protein
MYEEIMVQRRIRGEHAALGLGPGADMFDCGSFFSMEDDFRFQRACIRENKNDLIISSTSFTREDWVCTSCDKGHTLLPLRYEKDLWEGNFSSSRIRTCRRFCLQRRRCAPSSSELTEGCCGN